MSPAQNKKVQIYQAYYGRLFPPQNLGRVSNFQNTRVRQ